LFEKGNERHDSHRKDDGMSNDTKKPRPSSTGKSAKKRRQGVVIGDEEASDEDDEEDELHGGRMTTDSPTKETCMQIEASRPEVVEA
jgi:hypothetical protein